MKYTMEILGMHCPSCKKIIQMEMEDLGLSQVKVDTLGNTGTFECGESQAQSLVDTLGKNLSQYKFFNLKPV